MWSPLRPFPPVNADTLGRIIVAKEFTSPVSGTLLGFKVITDSGCQNRTHKTAVVVQRIDDPSDRLEIGLSIPDCTEVRCEELKYKVRGGKTYSVTLTSEGFKSKEKVTGQAAVKYQLWRKAAAGPDAMKPGLKG